MSETEREEKFLDFFSNVLSVSVSDIIMSSYSIEDTSVSVKASFIFCFQSNGVSPVFSMENFIDVELWRFV